MMALLKKLFRWLGLAVLGAVVFVALLLAFVAIVSPRIELSGLGPRLESVVGGALGRSVEIKGPLVLTLSLPPTVEISRLHVGNPPGWPESPFASIDSASATVQMTPLLRREIRVDDIKLDHVRLSLERNQQGHGNWAFPAHASNSQGPAWKLVEITGLAVSDASFVYRDRGTGMDVELHLASVSARLPARDPIQFEGNGVVNGFTFSAQMRTGSLAALTMRGQWPVDASLSINGNELQLKGSVTDLIQPRDIDLHLQLSGAQLAGLAEVLGGSAPAVGAYRVTGQVRGELNALQLLGIDGSLGQSTIAGDVSVAGLPDQPRITGSLIAGTLDPGPWQETDEGGREAGPGAQSGVGSPSLPEVELHLEVGEILNLPVEVRDVVLDLTLRDQELTAPLQLTVADVAVSGDVSITLEQGSYRARTDIHSRDVNIGGLVAQFTDLEGVEGSMGSLVLVASSQGTSQRSLIENLAVDLRLADISMSYGNLPGQQPVAVDIETASFLGRPGERATWSVEGNLLGEAFTASLRLGDLPTLVYDRKMGLDLHAAGAGVEVSLGGQLASAGGAEDTTLMLRMSGERFGRLAPWLGVADDVEVPYHLAGELWLQHDRDAWQLRTLDLRLGRTSIGGSIGVSRLGSKPLINASLAFDTIDPFELDRLFAPRAPAEQARGGDLDLEMPILPTKRALNDMDIEIIGERVVMEPSDITDIAFSTRIRGGHVSQAPFRGRLAETAFRGSLSMDLRGEVPIVELDVEADDVDVGQFLRELELATEIDAHTKRLTAKLQSRGSSMSEIFNNTRIQVEAHSGRWLLFPSDDGGGIDIRVSHGVATSNTSQRHTVVKLDAGIGGVPLDFDLETQRLPPAAQGEDMLAMKIRATAAGAELNLDGVAPRLRGFRDLVMEMSLHGERINSLDELVGVSLPPFGPYNVAGRLRIEDTGFSVSQIEVRVGSSSLNGHVEVATTGPRANAKVGLTAVTLQIDDFRLGDWKPTESPRGADAQDALAEGAPAGGPENDRSQRELLSREVMRSIDLSGRLTVEEVLSGPDRVGAGELELELQAGRLTIPLTLDLPGGAVDVALKLEAGEQEYQGDLRAKIDNFDYGIFARRIKSDSDMQGSFSLDTDLTFRGEAFSLLDDNAQGHFDFVIWPETLRGGIFDMWTANLLFALLPVLDPESESKVNCIVGRFNMKDGVMKPKPLFMDTTRSQVRGRGEINFRNDRINLRLTPVSKRPKFFSVSTPLVVEGSFSDFGVNMRPHDLLGTVIRMVYTGFIVPLQYVTRGVPPAVDTQECKKAMGVAGREVTEEQTLPEQEETEVEDYE